MFSKLMSGRFWRKAAGHRHVRSCRILLQKSFFADDQILRAVGATFVYKM